MTTRQDVPSDLEQIGLVTRYEIEKSLQSKAFIGIMGLIISVVALMTLVRPLLGIDFSSDPITFVQDYLSWVEILVLIGAVAFASGALSSEFEKRTGLLMFPQPVKRTTYLVGKFLSSLIILAVAMGLYYIIVCVLSLAIAGGIPGTILISYGFAMLYAAAVCAVALMLSSILRTNTAAIVATVLIFLMVMTIVEQLLNMSGVDPMFMISNAAGAISYSLQSPYPSTYTGMNFHGEPATIFIPTELGSVLVMACYIVVALVIATIAFKRRQL